MRRDCSQVLLNILSNAIKFTDAGGKVDGLGLTQRRQGGDRGEGHAA